MNEEELKEEIELLKEDLRVADGYFMSCSNKLVAAEKEIDELKQRLKDIKDVFEGCCYACEPVGMLNQELEAQLKCIEEDGTEEHNAAFDLRCKLAEALVEKNRWKDVAKKLYSVVLQLQEVSKTNMVVVVGPNFYSEAVGALNSYEELNGKDF